jgi:hypothetical protein
MFYFVGDFCVKNNQINKIYILKHIRYEICNKIYGIDLKKLKKKADIYDHASNFTDVIESLIITIYSLNN